MFDLQWSILNLAEFNPERLKCFAVIQLVQAIEPPLEGTMYAYETIDYWIMIDMNGLLQNDMNEFYFFSLCMMAIRIQYIRAYLPTSYEMYYGHILNTSWKSIVRGKTPTLGRYAPIKRRFAPTTRQNAHFRLFLFFQLQSKQHWLMPLTSCF